MDLFRTWQLLAAIRRGSLSCDESLSGRCLVDLDIGTHIHDVGVWGLSCVSFSSPLIFRKRSPRRSPRSSSSPQVITWEAAKEQIFEMPTGGAAIMRKGPNLLKLAKKEQCLALTTQLRTKFKISPCFYRVFPDGKVQYLHPADGVYPEKVNAGRVGANQNMRSIGANVNMCKVGSGD